MDQLIREKMLMDRVWKIRNEKLPNGVYTELPFDEAVVLYEMLKTRGMVAFKTWCKEPK